MASFSMESLCRAAGAALQTNVTNVDYEQELLQGGTVGEVYRLRGTAHTVNGSMPLDMVLKIQKPWERSGDPGSWRREYDIYHSGAYRHWPKQLRLPQPYLLEETAQDTRIWMEAIEGATGSQQLHVEELSLTAGRLGAFQAIYHQRGDMGLPFMRPFPAAQSSFAYWWGRMEPLLRKGIEGFPDDLRLALLECAEESESNQERLSALPRTLCQGDVHHDNLFLDRRNEVVYLIDWDTAGYGYMGEDAVDMLLEAFVYSDRDVTLLPMYRQSIVKAYVEGAAKEGIALQLPEDLIRGLFALSWGYRVADLYLYYEKGNPQRNRCLDILRAMLL